MAPDKGNKATFVMKCRVGLDGKWQQVPDRFCQLLDYSREELKKLTFADITHPDDRGKGLDLVERLKEGDLREFEYEKRYLTKSGDPVWVYVNGAIIKNNQGEPKYFVSYIHDITERKRAQKKLKQSEQQFRSLFKHNPHPVYYFDLEGKFQGVNQKLVEFSGYRREELIGMSYKSFIVEEDLERTEKQFEKAASGIPGEYEIQVIVRGGEKKDIRVTKFPMYVGDEVTGVYAVLQDITVQKRAQRRLKESEERWQRLVENNPQPVQVTQDARIIFINEAGAELYGADSPEEIIGKSVYEFCDQEKIEQVKQRKADLEQGKHVEKLFENKIIRLDGETRFVEINSIPITFRDKPAIQTVIHDITNRKEKEQNIQDSLDKKELLLKEIHHRVKNNLAVISGLIELQTMNIEEESTLNTLRDCQHRIHSIGMIHEKLYQSEALSDIGFDVYLKELVQSISRTYTSDGKKIDITYDLEPLSIDFDKAIPCSLIVNEVIVNCFKHAFKSTDEGKIKITSTFDEPEIIIKIEDDGSGFPADFDIGDQTSLGMTLMQTLARQLDGEINFLSEGKGKGVAFELRFTMA
jgi:PAS domain S-box-containing protein